MLIINSNPGSGNTYCSALLEKSLGYWVETFHQPHMLNEKIDQITLFRNPYDSVLSALEKHFQDVHPSLKPFDLNNEKETNDKQIKELIVKIKERENKLLARNCEVLFASGTKKVI